MEKQPTTRQRDNPTQLALQKTLEMIAITQESNPRTYKADFVNSTNTHDISQTLDKLIQNPCLPVKLYHPYSKFDLQSFVKQNPSIATVYHFPNVRLISTLQLIPNIYTIYSEPKPSLFSDTDRITALEQIRSSIRHDLKNALSGNSRFDKTKLIARATKELGFIGSEDEITTAIMERSKTIQPASFHKIDGFFVDWDSTLYKDKNFSRELFHYATSEAMKEKLPLAIWTGGNVDEVYRTLQQLNIETVDVCSKQDCKGLKITHAIDDENMDSLSEYGIEVENFQKISQGIF